MIARRIVVSIALGLAAPSLAGTLTRTSAFEYDQTSGLLVREIIEPGSSDLCLVTTYGYDVYGNRNSTTTRNCNGTSSGGVIEAPAPTGDAVFEMRTSSTTWNGGRFPTVSTNALGHLETRTFDLRFGSVINIVGPNDLVTRWNYDNLGRKTCERRSDGTATAWSYERCANGSCPTSGTHPTLETQYRVAVTAPGAPTTSTYYDRLNREVRIETQAFDGTLATQALKDMEYDAFGRVSRASRPYFVGATQNWTTLAYDVLGRVKQVEEPPVPEITRTTTTYSGLVTTATVSNVVNGVSTGVGLPGNQMQTRTTTKNKQGQVVQISDTQNNLLRYAYDEFGNLKTTTDALGNVTTLSYDLRGRKFQMLDPDMGKWTYRYNALGEMIRQCDPNSRAIQSTGTPPDCTDTVATRTTYDLLGRMKTRTERDLVSTWTYDTCTKGKGKLCQASADNGYSRTHGYDSLGRPQTLNMSMGIAYAVSTSYVNDGGPHQGKVDTLTYPTGFGVRNKYDAFGSLSELRVSNPSGNPAFAANDTLLWQVKKFSASGRVTKEVLGGTSSSLTQDSLFDAVDRLKSVVASGPGGLVHSLTYTTYDPIGNVKQRDDNVNNITENFDYDNLNRLIFASGRNLASGQSLTTRSFEYIDPIGKIGNISYKSDVGTYTYPPSGPGSVRPHAVSSVSGAFNATYGYDANGNLTQVSVPGGNPCPTPQAVGERCVTYMSFNMPASIKGKGASGSNATYTYTYSPEHERVRLEKQIATGTQTSIYLHPGGGGNLFYEKETQSDLTLEHRHYVQAGTMLVGVYVTTSTGGEGQMRYFHRDNVGSIMAVSNSAGARLEPLGYEAFGQRRGYNGAADPSCGLSANYTDRGFTAHEHLDDGLCLIHMNGRVYDPRIARFLTADPFVQSPANLQSYNRYSYVLNNPLAYTDPNGYFNLGKALGLDRPLRAITDTLHGIWNSFYNDPGSFIVTVGITIMTGYVIGDILAGYDLAAETSTFGFATTTYTAMGGVIPGYTFTWTGQALIDAGSAYVGGFAASGGDFRTALRAAETSFLVMLARGGWELMANETDRLARLSQNRSDCGGRPCTAGTRVLSPTDSAGNQITNVPSATGVARVGINNEVSLDGLTRGPHPYYDWIPGAPRFVELVSKVHDFFNELAGAYDTIGRYVPSRSGLYNDLFNLYSFYTMVPAAAYTAFAFTPPSLIGASLTVDKDR